MSNATQPVAWANADDDGIYEVGLSEAHAQYVCDRAAHGKYSHRNPRIVPLYRQPQPTLTDEERVDVAMWLSECLRQCSLATDGGSEEVAERWRNRSERAAQMLERLR